MEGRFNDKQLEWVTEVLNQHGRFMSNLLKEQIERKKLKATGDLENSVQYTVGSYGLDPHLSMKFLDYGRFIEINYHKSHNTSRFTSLRPNGVLMALQSTPQAGRKKKKDTRWYAKTVYGSLNRLIGILLYQYGSGETEKMKFLLDLHRES